MIKHLLLFISFLPLSLSAQTNVAGKTTYSEVVDVKGASAKTLTDRATTFMKLKKIEVKTAGNILSGIGTFNVVYPSVKKGPENGHVKFNLKIMVKDGKYKVDMTDFKHEGIHGRGSGGPIDLESPECGPTQLLNEAWAQIKTQNQEQIKSFVKELKTKMDHPVKAAAPSSDF